MCSGLSWRLKQTNGTCVPGYCHGIMPELPIWEEVNYEQSDIANRERSQNFPPPNSTLHLSLTVDCQDNSMRFRRACERTRPGTFLKGVTELSVLNVRDVLESLSKVGKGSGEL